MTAVWFARLPFAFTTSVHIIFPGLHDRAVGVHRNPAHSVATYRRRALPPAALLAATWLVLKMTGCLERRARRSARVFLVGMLAFIVIVSVWTVLEFERIGQR
jgi:hypothetical protein